MSGIREFPQEPSNAVPPAGVDTVASRNAFVEAFAHSLDSDSGFWSSPAATEVRVKLYSLWAKANAEMVCLPALPPTPVEAGGEARLWLVEEHRPSGSIAWMCFDHEYQAREYAKTLDYRATVSTLASPAPAAEAVREAAANLLKHLDAYDFNERDPSGKLYEFMAALEAALAPAAQEGSGQNLADATSNTEATP